MVSNVEARWAAKLITTELVKIVSVQEDQQTNRAERLVVKGKVITRFETAKSCGRSKRTDKVVGNCKFSRSRLTFEISGA